VYNVEDFNNDAFYFILIISESPRFWWLFNFRTELNSKLIPIIIDRNQNELSLKIVDKDCQIGLSQLETRSLRYKCLFANLLIKIGLKITKVGI